MKIDVNPFILLSPSLYCYSNVSSVSVTGVFYLRADWYYYSFFEYICTQLLSYLRFSSEMIGSFIESSGNGGRELNRVVAWRSKIAA